MNKKIIKQFFKNKIHTAKRYVGWSRWDSPMIRGVRILFLTPIVLFIWSFFPIWLPIEIIGKISKDKGC